MTQPSERRFVMEPRLDAEVETINDALATKVETTDPRLSDQRVPTDNSVTSAKIANGAIVDEDVNASAAIAKTKIAGTAVTQADTGTVTSTMIANATIVNADIADTTIESAKLAAQDYIKFDTTYATGSTQAGELAWDQENETLEFMLDDHVTLQIGQEHVIRVKNNSGSVAIPERTVVMFAGAAGDTIKVSPAVSDGSINVNYLAGITTEQIDADGFGFVTQLGFINQVNTNAWTIGTLLYVDPATPGGLTSTEPESPAWTMPVAAVTKQNASAGRILVRSIPGGSGAGGGASVNVSDTAPAGGNSGDLWYDSNDGTLYVYYDDVDGNQWVQVQSNSALEGSILARLGSLEGQAIAYGAMSPNYIINGGMDIWQRGTSFSSPGTPTYQADRFITFQDGTGVTRTISQQTFTPGTSPIAGTEASYYLRYATTVLGTTTYQAIQNRIEDVRTLAGQTATFSFYAKADSAKTISLNIQQNFGSGGSSSAIVNNSTSYSVTTSWQRFTTTVTIPSLTGKTIGTSSFLQVGLEFGAQLLTLDLCGWQLERGNTATSFRRNQPNIQAELAACQRYYYRWTGSPGESLTNANFWITDRAWGVVALPVTMRVAPTINYSGNWHILAANSNMSCTVGATSSNINSFGIDVQTTGGIGTQNIGGTVRANVISGTSYVQATAEL